MDILSSAYGAWQAVAPLRSRRSRYKRFTYGDQWSDLMPDSKGRLVTEDTLIRSSGKRPIVNNLIRQLVKTIVGRYRIRAAEEKLYKGSCADLAGRNSLLELDCRELEEFLISGCAVQRIVEEKRFGGKGVWVDNVDIRRFFVNAFRDPRGWDIELAGMLHDMSFPEIINRFGRADRKRIEELHRHFDSSSEKLSLAAIGDDGGASVDFFSAGSTGKFRVIEIWSFDSRPVDNGTGMSFAWHCRWFAPDGFVLDEYDSPFAHRSHPFAVKFYPLTDGEVHSFVEDVIDQQKSVNSLLVIIDHLMATSAKGVLLFPVSQLPVGITLDDVAQRWAQSDGVIPVTGTGGTLPQQVVTNTANTGAYQLLQLQMKLFEDVSGVGSALLGKTATGATGSEMYESQIRNASIALADLFDTFIAFTAERNAKAASTRSQRSGK